MIKRWTSNGAHRNSTSTSNNTYKIPPRTFSNIGVSSDPREVVGSMSSCQQLCFLQKSYTILYYWLPVLWLTQIGLTGLLLAAYPYLSLDPCSSVSSIINLDFPDDSSAVLPVNKLEWPDHSFAVLPVVDRACDDLSSALHLHFLAPPCCIISTS